MATRWKRNWLDIPIDGFSHCCKKCAGWKAVWSTVPTSAKWKKLCLSSLYHQRYYCCGLRIFIPMFRIRAIFLCMFNAKSSVIPLLNTVHFSIPSIFCCRFSNNRQPSERSSPLDRYVIHFGSTRVSYLRLTICRNESYSLSSTRTMKPIFVSVWNIKDVLNSFQVFATFFRLLTNINCSIVEIWLFFH